jgi:hypothetical protein
MYDIDFISHENGNKLNTFLSFGERCKGKSTEKYAFCPSTMGVGFSHDPIPGRRGPISAAQVCIHSLNDTWAKGILMLTFLHLSLQLCG